MRIYPPVTEDEAREWLSAQATDRWGADAAAALTGDIAALAKSMSVVSSIQLPDELEPLFP